MARDVISALERPPALARLPRVPLAFKPTPVQPLPRLGEFLGRAIMAKRDDLTGLALGGNKARKLEYLIADALAKDCDCVVATGFVQSNNVVQTAAAARRYGLEPFLILDGTDPGGTRRGNLVLSRLLGANMVFTDGRPVAATMEAEAARLRSAGRRPYVLPPGGSTPLGIAGFVEAAFEIAEQIAVLQPAPDVLVLPTGTGGTQAGLVLGLAMAGTSLPVIGVSTGKSRDEMVPSMTALAADAADLLCWSGRIPDAAWHVDERFFGAGYARPDHEDFAAIAQVARLEGLFTDPVYTGRLLKAVKSLVSERTLPGQGPILFWHTGGHAALFAFDEPA